MNKTNPAIMGRTELANTALSQTKDNKTTQQQAMEIVVLQTQKLQVLEDKLKQQLANIATNSGSSIPRQISATIDTSISGGSTTSTVTKEEMMQMFTKFIQNLQQGQYTEINPKGTKVPEKKTKKSKFGTNAIPNDLGGGQQSKRQYPDSTNYCPSCGYDIKPTHTSVTCTNQKSFHNKAATINNYMGGVSTNCHFITADK